MRIGYLTIQSSPPGADVYIDDIPVLDENGDIVKTPIVLTITVGLHNIRLTLSGYCDEFDSQYIEDGDNVNIFHNFYICE